MRHSARILLFAATMAATVILVACADDEEISPSPSPGAGAETDTPTATARPTDAASPSPILPTFTPEPETSPTPVPGVDPGISQEFLQVIIDRDLRWQAGLESPEDFNSVEVISSEPMSWPDNCMDLAEPNLCDLSMEPADGYLITLLAAGGEPANYYTYHAQELSSLPERGVFWLFAGTPESLDSALDTAKNSVSHMSGIPAQEIELLNVRNIIFPDSCLGEDSAELCTPPLGVTPGYIFEILAGGQVYEIKGRRT